MQLNAKTRQETGKKNKPLRRQSVIPCVLMEKGKASLALSLDLVSFNKVYAEAGETSLIDLVIDSGAKQKVLVSEVQLHPVSLFPIHVSFRKVNLKEKITAQVPVHIVNEEQNPQVKSGDAVVLKLLDEIAVSALPADLPKEFVIDALKLVNIGDEVKVADLDYDRSKVEITEHKMEDPVVRLDKAEEMKVEEEAQVTEEEALSKVTATEELSEEEKAKRVEEKKQEKQEKPN